MVIHNAVAPVIMTPRMINATAASSSKPRSIDSSTLGPNSLRRFDFASLGRAPLRLGVGSRRITSTDLQIVEATSELLSADVPEPEGVASDVSLLRGFKATIPSSEKGKERRRKVRNVDAPHMGLKKLGMSARGMLTEDDVSEASHDEFGTPTRTIKGKGGKRKGRESLSANVKLGREELSRQKDEIILDKENLHVRRVSILVYRAPDLLNLLVITTADCWLSASPSLTLKYQTYRLKYKHLTISGQSLSKIYCDCTKKSWS